MKDDRNEHSPAQRDCADVEKLLTAWIGRPDETLVKRRSDCRKSIDSVAARSRSKVS